MLDARHTTDRAHARILRSAECGPPPALHPRPTRGAIAIMAAVVVVLATAGAVHAAGEQAPDFTLRDLGNQKIHLGELSDKVVLLAFWASWCESCMNELRQFEKLHRTYRDRGLVVVGVSVDGPETRGLVPSIAKRQRLSFPIAIDDDFRVANLYNPRLALPFSALLARGRIVRVQEGYQPCNDQPLEEELRRLLGKS